MCRKGGPEVGSPLGTALHDPDPQGHGGVGERIWTVVGAIPPGSVATYGQVAELAGLPRGARRVGQAMSRLPPGTRLPWHRVINAAGTISLRGTGAARQRAMLEAEGVIFVRGRVNLDRFGWRP